MTPTDEQRASAREAAKRWLDAHVSFRTTADLHSLANLLLACEQAAAEREREECAKVMEMKYNHPLESAAYCARLIRARGGE